MDEPRFYQRPWVYIFFWIVICGGIYFWQIRGMGGIRANLVYIFIDGFIFVIGLLVWLAFFAQFVLPMRTFSDRQKIFDRLLTYLGGGHGPAIFVRDGKQVKRQGEAEKKGPGVLWLDSASAAVTRTAVAFKHAIGPGVHFTDKNEYLASTVDLHTQMQKLGPREKEDVFAPKPDKDVDTSKKEKYDEVQKRRVEVSAWTRDGIEVVPNITVVFKIDAAPAKREEAGSRFGFEPEAVRKAVTGEGINPGQPSNIPRRRVAWNQLPALIAVDLWREYLAKFTLQELFETNQTKPQSPSAPSGPIPAETQALYQPSLASGSALSDAFAGILHDLNAILARLADRCEFGGKEIVRIQPDAPKALVSSQGRDPEEKITALQAINHMIKLRMTQVDVPVLDDSGQPDNETHPSSEFQLLKDRGLKIIAVSVGGLRFSPAIEEQLIRQWSTTWLDNARAERDRIERQRSFAELDAGVEAFGTYAKSLSENLLKDNPGRDLSATLKNLLLRTRDELVKDDRLHRRASMEREELETIIQWVERNSI